MQLGIDIDCRYFIGRLKISQAIFASDRNFAENFRLCPFRKIRRVYVDSKGTMILCSQIFKITSVVNATLLELCTIDLD